jgi:uncharacterized protein involved in exopolysaccharide biosynthesis
MEDPSRHDPPEDAVAEPAGLSPRAAVVIEPLHFEPRGRASDSDGTIVVRLRAPDVQSAPIPTTGDGGAGDDAPIIDFGLIFDYGGFVLGALRRRKLIAGTTLLLTLALVGVVVVLWPRTYHVGAKLLSQRGDVMAAISNPSRARSVENDSPTRAAAETVLRRDNLVALVKQTNLIEEWDRTRSPLLRAKDAVVARVSRRKPTNDERLDALVGLLEARIAVAVGVEGTVNIDIDWPDARLAYELVEAALQNFLETRQVAETSAISGSVSILERYATSLEAEITQTIAEVQAEQAARKPTARAAQVERPRSILAVPPKPVAPVAPIAPVAPRPTDLQTTGTPEVAFRVARLKAALEAKRSEVARLEDFRRQQISELQSQLSTALTIYTDGHPAVAALRQSIASQSRESPQLTSLKNEAQTLESQYEAAASAQAADEQRVLLAGRAAAAAAAAAQAEAASPRDPLPRTTGMPELPRPALVEMPTLEPMSEYSSSALAHVRLEIAQLGDIRDRLQSARIELTTAQAGFKYRYSVIQPSQVPRQPTKPNVLAVSLAGIVGAILLAIFVAVGSDLLSDRILEAWQMDRQVGAPVLIRMRGL